ncbi:uncharacterized protein BDZ99DRAFT_517618 [Mytilinidion resinicola]|uniref:Uncharacterized protein n=1 Tax=Mytilinidion resinicola TaxID=574789 RepID=A0A6A6YXR1_9PEZI|nr:uncharacterized protein BDZ99DRAFT_517618 [Mytilinidion resinicola]KAF2813348.1 hypothetical protein BDZ99DRAFT_517618 [Mytilinidion resinicola]
MIWAPSNPYSSLDLLESVASQTVLLPLKKKAQGSAIPLATPRTKSPSAFLSSISTSAYFSTNQATHNHHDIRSAPPLRTPPRNPYPRPLQPGTPTISHHNAPRRTVSLIPNPESASLSLFYTLGASYTSFDPRVASLPENMTARARAAGTDPTAYQRTGSGGALRSLTITCRRVDGEKGRLEAFSQTLMTNLPDSVHGSAA